MTDNSRTCIDKITRRARAKRLRAFLVDMLCFDVAVLCSFLGWLPRFTGIPYGDFLAATATLGVLFAGCIHFGKRQP